MPLYALATSLLAATAYAATPNNFEIVGNSGVSAQQLFLDQYNSVIIVDKTENNGNNFQINGRPAWGSRWNISARTAEPMDVVSNSFCAGGNVLGNGTWLNVGGNQAVTYGGLAGTAGYQDADGGRAIRTYTPCNTANGETCDWTDTVNGMTTRRWYPVRLRNCNDIKVQSWCQTLETLEDGSIIIIGGCDWGGYVNDAGQNNPTYEFYPSKGDPIGLNILTSTLPANLFVLTWLLPSGRLFINSNLGNELFDYKNNVEYALPATPHSVRTYPGNAANAMLPLTPANNWTATIWMCGGTNLQPDVRDFAALFDVGNVSCSNDDTCISITPDNSTDFQDEESLPEARVMGNMIALPDGRFVILNGIAKGTAGYGNTSWAVGQAFGTDPIYSPLYFGDPALPAGSRFYRDGMGNSTVPRLYHSSATLLPDGSILSSGSNPNADYIAPNTPGYTWNTEYRTEYFYPDYYNERRPEPQGLPTTLSYGGAPFNVTLSKDDVGSDASILSATKVVVIRPGFSTHAVNFGQRYVQLNSTAAYDSGSGGATLFVSQVPPNPAIIAPGPALIFVVVDGIPSIGQWIMVGNGELGNQPIATVPDLPPSSGFTARTTSSSEGSASDAANHAKSGAVTASLSVALGFSVVAALAVPSLLL